MLFFKRLLRCMVHTLKRRMDISGRGKSVNITQAPGRTSPQGEAPGWGAKEAQSCLLMWGNPSQKR